MLQNRQGGRGPDMCGSGNWEMRGCCISSKNIWVLPYKMRGNSGFAEALTTTQYCVLVCWLVMY